MKTEPSSLLLKDVAYFKIKKGILEERYKPGSFLSEKELIDELEMSKTPIKSAIVRLEAEGFVTVSDKRGININDLSIDRINDIYNLRIALETFNCEQIYNRVSKKDLDSLEKNINEMASIVEDLDVPKFAEMDHVFHRLISNIAGNQEIQRILLNYHDHLYRITLRHLNKEPERMKKFFLDHQIIFKELKNHDVNCVNTMKKHLEESKLLLFQ
ncbi:GntR family transcriptional regulator [Alteribacillus sp. YIM 98480]|uniref:GntR family transcriptional regulator n=1 Tax=Alteribacillus sp. YIM 98480 TaxID=2606599 RepID=UPI001E40EA94|nr:GntR family transcriptional regulator [Alteribacillus sp. YIM 98480]